MIGRLLEPQLDRTALRLRYAENRRISASIFDLVRAAMTERPLPLRLPFQFYLGHLPVFSYVTLARRALGLPAIDEHFERLFCRGIDPNDHDEAELLQPSDWPDIETVFAYGRRADAVIDTLLAEAQIVDASHPMLIGGEAVYTILEHEEMHHETLLYIVSCLDDAKKTTDGMVPHVDSDVMVAPARGISIPAGRATLGAQRGSIPFGWDNEFEEHRVDVAAFEVDSRPVTNKEYLAFVNAGATAPVGWLYRDGAWYQRTPLGIVPLQLAWPVSVTYDQAQQYAVTHGGRIMTESEFHRAAYANPDGDERQYPWGDQPPSRYYVNGGMERYTPEPVGQRPWAASAWGVEELVGNGWEWTSSLFEPFPGFEVMASYPQYSADFFQGRHRVLKGASCFTAFAHMRRSFRNWFFADYPYASTKFRLAYGGVVAS